MENLELRADESEVRKVRSITSRNVAETILRISNANRNKSWMKVAYYLSKVPNIPTYDRMKVEY